ncbi:MAG: hypothetical protein QGG14_02985 [Planctomycetota bacterium]|jgi:hypothetical protein|nr:hypothetical protein [Planctomycetota bacterium]
MSDEQVRLGELLEHAQEHFREALRTRPFYSVRVIQVGASYAWLTALKFAGILTIATFAASFLDAWPLTAALLSGLVLCVAWFGMGLARHLRAPRQWQAEADVALAALVMANEQLFDGQEGKDVALPGVVVLTREARRRADGPWLSQLAERLFALNAANAAELAPRDAETARTLARVQEEGEFVRWRVPHHLADNDDTWLVGLWLDRDHMPAGRLDRRLWLCLSHPSDQPSRTCLLPPEHWYSPSAGDLLSYLEDTDR